MLTYLFSDQKPLLKIFTGHTNNAKYNTWSLEAAAIPRCVKVLYIKEIANILADSVSRLRVGGLYHDLELNDHQQEFSAPFEPLPPVELMPLEVNENFISPNIETCVQNYDTLNDLPTAWTDEAKLCLENVSSTDIAQLEQNLMSLLELTPDKVTKLQKHHTFGKNLIQHIDCSRHDNYFIYATVILHKKGNQFQQ